MTPFRRVEAPACPLAMANIDTDQLIPSRFLRRPRHEGYGRFLFHDLRFGTDGETRQGFILDDERVNGAAVLVAQRNFGCGSSREAAVYALLDFGLRVVVAPGFGHIFASSAVRNGLLPAQVSETDGDRLLQLLLAEPGLAATVDLPAQTVHVGSCTVPFAIEPAWKDQLLSGGDEIAATLALSAEIEDFCRRDRAARPWAAPRLRQ